jgi:O-antigen ligase
VTFSALVVLHGAGSVQGEAMRDRAVAWIVGAVVLGALLGAAQAYGWEAPLLAGDRPPGGTFGNRNFLAHLSAIAAPPLLALGLAGPRWRGRALAITALGIVILAVVLTRSRAAWLAGAAGLVVTGACLLRSRRHERLPARKGTAWIAVAIIGATTAAVALPNALDWREGSPYAGTLSRLTDFRGGSGRGRLIQYGNSLELAKRHPVLGVGPGNWFVHYPTVTKPGDPAFGAHLAIPTNPWPSSDWVAMVSERGALGALLLLAAGLTAFARAWSAGGTTGGTARRGGALAGLLVAAGVAGLFDAVLLLPAPALVVAALVGLLLPTPDREAAAPRLEASKRRAWHWGGLVVVGLLASYTGLHTTAVAATARGRTTADLARAANRAPWDYRLRLALAERGRCEDARTAARLMPHHARPAELVRDCSR